MEPIVSPWIFYVVGVCETTHNILEVSLVIEVGVGIFFTFVHVATIFDGEEVDMKAYYRRMKGWGYVLAITVGLTCIVPSPEILYKMLAASLITPDNIQAVQGNIVDFVGQIAEQLQKVKG